MYRSSLVVATALALVAAAAAGCSAEAPDEGMSEQDAEVSAEAALASRELVDFEDDEEDLDAVPDGEAQPITLSTSVLPRDTFTDRGGSVLGAGSWAYKVEVVRNAGAPVILASQAAARVTFAASVFKLFTGWTAFKSRSTAPSTLTVMLRRSDNALANLALCRSGEVLGEYDVDCRAQAYAPPRVRLADASRLNRGFIERRVGSLSTSFRMTDGSGLLASNRMAIDDVTRLLEGIRRDGDYKAFRAMLAQPGVSSTLATRFRGYEGRLFAKTGTYRRTGGGVRGLAGFFDLGGDRTLVFAVVGVGTGDPKAAMSRIERFVRVAVDEATDPMNEP